METKGTGHARQGSIRAPQWKHGGIALGPKPRKYHFALNKKLRRVALLSALSSKAAEGTIVVLDQLKLDEIKTKAMIGVLKAVGAEGKALVVMPEVDLNVVKSARNIPDVKTTLTNTLNVYDILYYDKFVIVKDAVEKIEEVYAK